MRISGRRSIEYSKESVDEEERSARVAGSPIDGSSCRKEGIALLSGLEVFLVDPVYKGI